MRTLFLLTGLMLLCPSPPDACGQYPASPPWVMPPADPRERRLLRERAVRFAGPDARFFVESPEIGDDAALALLMMCYRKTATQLAAFYASGEFSTLPRQRDFLRVIAQPDCRDAVALWVIQQSSQLADPEYADVFLASPLEFALGLKPLDAAVIERRQSLAAPAPSETTAGLVPNRKSLVWCAGLVVVIGLFLWRKHRQRNLDTPA
jgi:hypothetical protein